MTKVYFITAVTISFFLPYSHQTIIHVSSCPTNKHSWEQRSSIFLCEPFEEYHCIQTTDHTLIETCMTVYHIPVYKGGCPWVKIINGKVYLHNPFTPCHSMHTDCPVGGHKKYRSNELYIYPACIKAGIITTLYTTELVDHPSTDTTFVQEKHYRLNTPVIIVFLSLGTICLCTAAFIMGCIYLIRRRKSDGSCSKVQNQHKDQGKNKILSDSMKQTRQESAHIQQKGSLSEATTGSEECISILPATEKYVDTNDTRHRSNSPFLVDIRRRSPIISVDVI